MSHRRLIRLRLVSVAVAVAVVALSCVVLGSPATLDGVETDEFGAAFGDIERLTSVQIEWNRDARDVTRPSSVRLSAQGGQMFEADDLVDITATGTGSDSCSARTTVETPSAVVDVEFPACGVVLWELQGVTVSISGRDTAAGRNTEEVSRRSRASFSGPVVQPDADVASSFTITHQGGTEMLSTLRLTVGDATAEQLIGRRLTSALSTAKDEPDIYVGTVGTIANNQGVWVEEDPKTARPVVIADMSRLASGQAPGITGAPQFRMVLLQPQRLGAGQTPANQFALTTAAGTLEG